MKVAVSTAIGCDASLDVALDRIVAVGCPLVDILTIDGWVHVLPSRLVEDFEGECAAFESKMSARGLTAIATNSGLGVQLHDRSPESHRPRAERLAALLRFLKRQGIGFAAIQPLGADRSRPDHEVILDCAESLREQFAGAQEVGIPMALELHVHSPIETLDQAQILFDLMPDLPLVYDPTHFVMQGLPIHDTQWIMARAKHAHFRDAARGQMQTPFGEGEVDFDWVLKAMQDLGFTGNISIEYLGTTDFDVVDSARRLYEFLAERLA